jgi:hypothetical protein
MNISHKLCVPSLQKECLTFLLTHAAGRPIKAMRIAELFEEEELYRESSRFVLDNPGGWAEQELNTLSQETLLKLEKRSVLSAFSTTAFNEAFKTELVSGAGVETWFDHGRKGVSMRMLGPFETRKNWSPLTVVWSFSVQPVQIL